MHISEKEAAFGTVPCRVFMLNISFVTPDGRTEAFLIYLPLVDFVGEDDMPELRVPPINGWAAIWASVLPYVWIRDLHTEKDRKGGTL